MGDVSIVLANALIKKPELHEVYVGWNQLVGTFFITVNDKTVEEEDYNLILSQGNHKDEIPTVEKLKKIVAPYGELSDEVVNELEKAAGIAREPVLTV